MENNNITVLPPYTNRGVVNTLQSGLRSCVDWLQVTFKNVQNVQQIIDVLGLNFDDFTEFENGKYGYHSHIRFGHIAIYYSSNLEHFHLEISGQGCREYEEYGNHDWVTLLGLILMLDVNITRFDIAIDDFEGYFKFPQLIKKIKKGHVRSRFRTARIQEKVVLNDGSTAGTTIYFGSPKSEIQVRIYDKLQERLSAGKEIEDGIEVWNRTELQLRDKRALTAAFELVENIYSVGPLVQGLLRNYVLFCNPTDDSNKARWPISKFWIKFLDNIEPLRLSQVAP
ncbi:replication initiation factor domain-containing protein, partial [Peribacillus sp. TH16]